MDDSLEDCPNYLVYCNLPEWLLYIIPTGLIDVMRILKILVIRTNSHRKYFLL